MAEINLPRAQQQAITAIDAQELDRLIDKAILTESFVNLRAAVGESGTFIGAKLLAFERALAAHGAARAASKRELTGSELRRAGDDLLWAVDAMKRRVEEDHKDSNVFFIDDWITPPFRFDGRLSVRVSYRWRPRPADDWRYGAITFTFDVDMRPDFTGPSPPRMLSAAKREREVQARLSRIWEELARGALFSVRDYFKEGGDGAKIPDSFAARPDQSSRGLNNFSTLFWRDPPRPGS